jgi:hypothetical protein
LPKHSNEFTFENLAAWLRENVAPPRHNPMSMQLGYALLRDRRVSIRAKLIALGIGAATIGAIELLQLPVEGVIAALLPFVGVAGDLALDGAEAVIGPVLIATLLLPHLAPAEIVQQIRAERARGS